MSNSTLAYHYSSHRPPVAGTGRVGKRPMERRHPNRSGLYTIWVSTVTARIVD